MREVFKVIGKVSGNNVTVLIEGESGTGKELVAKAIHLNSDRASNPCVAINSAAIPKDLLESELIQIQPIPFAKDLVESLVNKHAPEEEVTAPAPPAAPSAPPAAVSAPPPSPPQLMTPPLPPLPPTGSTDPVYDLPGLPAGPILFASQFFEPEVAADEARRSGLWVGAAIESRLWPTEERPVRPLMPLRRGHLAVLIAAGFLNMRNPDVVCLQHEYGIYGGQRGSFIAELAQNLKIPLITTLHTVLRDPSSLERRIISQLAELSTSMVVMTEHGVEFLRDIYHVPESKIALIPHGIKIGRAHV